MIDRGNIFKSVSTEARRSEVFEEIIRNPELLLERIVSHGQATPPGEWYDQERDEWVVLLSGRATIAFESGEAAELSPGDYLLIPAHSRHRVETTSADPPCVWLALHGNF